MHTTRHMHYYKFTNPVCAAYFIVITTQFYMESKHHQALGLFKPLLLPVPATSSPVESTTLSNVHVGHFKAIITSSSDILLRFACIILIATIALWANYEASKGFTITVINDAGDSSAGKWFSHFYISDDKATRIIIDASNFVENILYPRDHLHNHQSRFYKKQVNHVILRLANQDISTDIIVESRANNEYVLHLNPSIMKHKNFKHAVVSAIQRGMARIWLWDGHGTVPEPLINGTIEYISQLKQNNLSENSTKTNRVTEMLVNCVKQNSGFIQQLNQAMRDYWHDSAVDIYSVDANLCNYKFHN